MNKELRGGDGVSRHTHAALCALRVRMQKGELVGLHEGDRTRVSCAKTSTLGKVLRTRERERDREKEGKRES